MTGARRLIRFSAGALVSLGLMLSACDQLPPDAIASATAGSVKLVAKPAGKNAVGEVCTYQPGNASELGTSIAAYEVRCGTWVQPSGKLFQLNGAGADATRFASEGPWRTYIDQQSDCQAPQSVRILDGISAAVMRCTKHSGGWPHVAMAAVVDGSLYAMDGVPSAEPALEATVAALTGRRVPDRDSAQSSREGLAALLGGQAFGSGDLDRYYGLMRLGAEQNAVDNFVGAEDALRDALAVQQRVLGANNPGLGVTQINLALQISNQNRFDEADGWFAQAARLNARTPNSLFQARYDFYLGLHLLNQTKFEEAQASLARAEREFAAYVPTGLKDAAMRGSVSGQSGLADLGDSLLIDPDAQLAISGLAAVWRTQALVDYQQNQPEEAVLRAQRSRRLAELGGNNQPGFVPRTLLVVGLGESKAGRGGDSSDTFRESAELFTKALPNTRPTAIAYFLTGRTLARNGERESALASFREGARIVRQRRLGMPEPLVSPYLDTLYDAAKADPAKAVDLYAEMFEAAQMTQSSLTAQYIAKAAARLAAGDQKVSSALRRLQQIDLELKQLFADRDTAAQQKSGDADAAENLKKADAAIADALKRRADAESAAQAAAPAYGQLLQTGTAVKTVQELLRPQEALITFFAGTERSYGFVVQHSAINGFEVALTRRQTVEMVTALRTSAQLDVSGADVKIPAFDLTGAHTLYADLLKPAEPLLKDTKELVIAPSVPLLSLPFEMLVTAPGVSVADGDYGKVPFLIRRFEVSYVPAVQTFVDLRHIKSASNADRPFLGFGDFRPSTHDQLAASFPADRCKTDLEGVSSLGPLPGTHDEILSVGQLLGARPDEMILGADFTKDRFLSYDLRHYRVVHLATHALLPSELHCRTEPSILMSNPPNAPDATGAFLGVDEVLKLQLDADLVILSACNTAGPSGSGAAESLSGLARAFFFAGTRGLLVTHWSVEDNSAKLIVTHTMASLSGGIRRADTSTALRAAKLEMLDGDNGRYGKLFTHPFAWAPFVLIGDGARVGSDAPAAPAQGVPVAQAAVGTASALP
ncbi:MAG TPA: CHAT domain-containing protein [Aliidongia sp.]|uniref:CHAT domain-containing protein n=1 Tax=Aliidongia sp. TaxID=1914230 RepID=UPI002DDCA229|nr:CHAT domain-containing protein [Aliidongia sp.]HEV2675033.1 CHAT domain-containing protein [Aliidongia sp.]